MELSRKQKIIAAVIFFLVIGSAAAVYMITSYERMDNDENRISAEESSRYLKVKDYAHDTLKAYAKDHNTVSRFLAVLWYLCHPITGPSFLSVKVSSVWE